MQKMHMLMLYGITAALLAGTAAAQTDRPGADPASAAAPVPPTIYQSAFRDYVPFREPAIGDWRALNEEVGRIGGHIGIFRPSAQGESTTAPGPGSRAHSPHH